MLLLYVGVVDEVMPSSCLAVVLSEGVVDVCPSCGRYNSGGGVLTKMLMKTMGDVDLGDEVSVMWQQA